MSTPDARERAYLKKTFTVFLGRSVFSDGGGFDYWGDPDTGSVISVGVKGRQSSSFGDAGYWAGHVSRDKDLQTTDEGRRWDWQRFRKKRNPGKRRGNPSKTGYPLTVKRVVTAPPYSETIYVPTGKDGRGWGSYMTRAEAQAAADRTNRSLASGVRHPLMERNPGKAAPQEPAP